MLQWSRRELTPLSRRSKTSSEYSSTLSWMYILPAREHIPSRKLGQRAICIMSGHLKVLCDAIPTHAMPGNSQMIALEGTGASM